MNSDIKIYKKNESIITIQCSDIISKELRRYFSIKAANYRFSPLYKQGIWSGDIFFFNADHELSIGLIEKVYEFARIGKYTIECKFDRFNQIDKKEFKKFVDSLKITNDKGQPMEIRPYQFDAAYEACCKKHLNIQISTAGGKSLVLYIICRFLQMQNLKTLLVVPTVQLVKQMHKDFQSYGWDSNKYCHEIFAGQEKVSSKPIDISTWQSIYNKKDLFSKYSGLLVDECHSAKSKSLQNISKNCVNAEYRFGCSGTYPDFTSADWYTIVGATGAIKIFANYDYLQKEGYIAQLRIYSMILEYDKKFRERVYWECKKDYPKESDMIYSYPGRYDFLLKMVDNLKENCLVLFTKKEAHGYVIRDFFKKNLKDRMVLYVDGDMPLESRDDIKPLMENNNGVVLLATYGTLSTGISINNIHHVIFASSYKSKIKVLQSIGRGLRLHKDKKCLKVYDITDDVSYENKKEGIKYRNHSMKHLKDRLKYYQDENLDYKIIKFKIN